MYQAIAGGIRWSVLFSQGAAPYEQAIEMLTRRHAALAPMHTHEFPLEQVGQAIETLAGERPGEEAVCISIHPGKLT